MYPPSISTCSWYIDILVTVEKNLHASCGLDQRKFLHRQITYFSLLEVSSLEDKTWILWPPHVSLEWEACHAHLSPEILFFAIFLYDLFHFLHFLITVTAIKIADDGTVLVRGNEATGCWYAEHEHLQHLNGSFPILPLICCYSNYLAKEHISL